MSIAHPYMLDTNAASTLIRGRVSEGLQNLLMEHSACVSVITEAELRFGVKRRPDATRLAKAVEAFLQDTPVLPWTSSTAHAYAELRTHMETQGIGLSAMDMLIAAHAIAAGCTLLSADRAFMQVPDLRVIDWSSNSAATPAQKVRDKLARAGITTRDIKDAIAQTRTAGRHAAPKTKAVKKAKAK
ncbi:MAG: type II toxin-antitoxin system VapC family toxin [Gallionella sp.]|nr:type II toxin-antitoxin system VapC family toxin [Gallionella sp.]